MRVRELGDQDGFCPETSTVGEMLPSAGITQISNSPDCDVKAIHLPSGDQSGSVGFGAPVVFKSSTSPPSAETLARWRRSDFLVAKQIQRPSGDQVGEESSTPVVTRRRPVPSQLQTQILALPDLLRTIATREPSGETAALVFRPE